MALRPPSASEGRPCSWLVCVVPKRVIAFNDRRAVGAVFGVGLASIGILPTSATVYGLNIHVGTRRHGIAALDIGLCVVYIYLVYCMQRR